MNLDLRKGRVSNQSKVRSTTKETRIKQKGTRPATIASNSFRPNPDPDRKSKLRLRLQLQSLFVYRTVRTFVVPIQRAPVLVVMRIVRLLALAAYPSSGNLGQLFGPKRFVCICEGRCPLFPPTTIPELGLEMRVSASGRKGWIQSLGDEGVGLCRV